MQFFSLHKQQPTVYAVFTCIGMEIPRPTLTRLNYRYQYNVFDKFGENGREWAETYEISLTYRASKVLETGV